MFKSKLVLFQKYFDKRMSFFSLRKQKYILKYIFLYQIFLNYFTAQQLMDIAVFSQYRLNYRN